MPDIMITCPYCFSKFEDDKVHFRMETCYKDEKAVINNSRFPDIKSFETADPKTIPNYKELREQINRRKVFLKGESDKYTHFWEDYLGKSTEETDDGFEIIPYERPVLPADSEYIDPSQNGYDFDTGMLESVIDNVENHRTYRRVCPFCHNPLPRGYGKYKTIFFSIIGAKGSGKTVFLSQLCRLLNGEDPTKRDFNYLNLSFTATGYNAKHYSDDNLVRMNVELPMGTMPKQLVQPIFFHVARDGNTFCTMVLYDIAGETCADEKMLDAFGRFVKHSHGLILLFEPDQIDYNAEITPETIINAIYNSLSESFLKNLPTAVCISKGDLAFPHLNEIPSADDLNDVRSLLFNAGKYNEYYSKVEEYINKHHPTLLNSKLRFYDRRGYFVFSALGCGTKEIEITNPEHEKLLESDEYESEALQKEVKRTAPVANPNSRRIYEPLAWLFWQLDYIDADGDIREPGDWKCKKCGHYCRKNQETCEECGINREGKKRCEKCGECYDWELGQCPNPKHKGFLSKLFRR